MNWLLYDRDLRHERVNRICVDPSHKIGLFLYPLKTSENQRFPKLSGDLERDQWHEMG